LGIESPSVEESSQEISFSDLLIERTVQQELISDLLSLNQPFRWFAIVGESGTGKSSLLWLLSKNINLTLAIRGHDLIATRLKDRLCDDEQNSKKLSAFDENKKCIIKIIEEQIRKTDKVIYFFIDTLDLVINKIGESSLRYFLQDILDISQQLILVTTCRPREFKFLTKRFNEFNKAKESEKNPEKKHDYCSYEVKSFDNKELALVLKRYTSVYHENWSQQEQQDLVDRLKQLKNENREISQICRHPLSLRLLFEVYENRVPEDLNLSVLYK
jgi:ATP-dependent Clp protease ATP-binding subunit ClpA